MHLQRNDMLSTEGRAPRARRSCYVNEPAYGAGMVVAPAPASAPTPEPSRDLGGEAMLASTGGRLYPASEFD